MEYVESGVNYRLGEAIVWGRFGRLFGVVQGFRTRRAVERALLGTCIAEP